MMIEPDSNKSSNPPLQDDKVHSDFISGDNVSYQQINSFSGVAVGRGVQDSMSQTNANASLSEALSSVFVEANNQIQAMPASRQDKNELSNMVQRIEYEVIKGSAANPARLERTLRLLQNQSPDMAHFLTDQLSRLNLTPPVSKVLNLGGAEDPALDLAPPVLSSEDAVLDLIQNADLEPAAKNQLVGCVGAIQEEIDKETLTKGGWVDARRVQNALAELQRAANSLPDLRTGLWAWLVEGEGVPTSVRILTKKMFA